MFDCVDVACASFASTYSSPLFFFSDCRFWNLGGYIYIDRNVVGNRYNNSLSGMEDDTDIRGHDVLFILRVPRTGHYTRIFEQPLFWIAENLGMIRTLTMFH